MAAPASAGGPGFANFCMPDFSGLKLSWKKIRQRDDLRLEPALR
jgi:hypothetical protein